MIRLFRRSRSAELVEGDRLITEEQRRTLERATALANEAEETLAEAQREAERLRQDARARAEAEAVDRLAAAEAYGERIRAAALEAATSLVKEAQRRLDETTSEINELLGKAERLRDLLHSVTPLPDPPAIAPDQVRRPSQDLTAERDNVLSALKSLEVAISAASSKRRPAPNP